MAISPVDKMPLFLVRALFLHQAGAGSRAKMSRSTSLLGASKVLEVSGKAIEVGFLDADPLVGESGVKERIDEEEVEAPPTLQRLQAGLKVKVKAGGGHLARRGWDHVKSALAGVTRGTRCGRTVNADVCRLAGGRRQHGR